MNSNLEDGSTYFGIHDKNGRLMAAFSPMAEGSPATAVAQSQKLRRWKNPKLVAFVVLLIIFRATIITVLDQTILKIRRPSYRLSTIRIQNLVFNKSTNSPSFFMDLNAGIAFENKNLGPYTFEFGYLTFSYNGSRVGDVVVERSRVKMYSSKFVNLKVKLTSESVREKSNSRRDIGDGKLLLEVNSELTGKVGLMKVFKKDSAVKLNCSLTVDLEQKSVQELSCA